jgi:glutathione S-transferase
MRAVLRYRQIPFKWVLRDSKWDDIGKAPVPIIPVIVFPNADGSHGERMVDSSPQIMRLETEYVDRSIVPTDPALAFLDQLIEDFADEWLTKAMYHYRWAYDADIDKAGKLLPLSGDLQLTQAQAEASYEFITNRQIGRRTLVGSTESNQPLIEGSYRRVLEIMQARFDTGDFMLGDRPGRGDFGLYGQLSQLVKWDPTSMTVAVEVAPKVINWVERVDDLSWLDVTEDGWAALDDLDPATQALLNEIGHTYAPFMVANAKALMAGEDEVVCGIVGGQYRQGAFKYQGKCLGWLREGYEALDDADRSRVDAALAGTGCEVLFA